MRDNLVEALVSFKLATKNSVTIFFYTFMNESRFDLILGQPELAQLVTDNLVERVIFMEGYRHGSYPSDQLALSVNFLPQNTSEVLWIHPLGLDFNEVLYRVKTKKYERLLMGDDSETDGTIRTVACLPFISQNDFDNENKITKILEYTMLVSSLDFDIVEAD